VKKRYNSKPDDNTRMFVGLDVHKKYTEVAIVNENGVIEKQERIENEPGRIEDFSNRLNNAEMVLESSSTWYWLYEILSRKYFCRASASMILMFRQSLLCLLRPALLCRILCSC
jgi:hypothetical protein